MCGVVNNNNNNDNSNNNNSNNNINAILYTDGLFHARWLTLGHCKINKIKFISKKTEMLIFKY